MIERIKDFLFRNSMNRAIKRNAKRSVCMHCLKPLEWANFKDREIPITPSHRVMIFCPECDAYAKTGDSPNWLWVETAFRRWYYMLSGLGNGPYTYDMCLENVLQHYGWMPKDHWKTEPHPFEGRLDRWCELCNQPDRAPIHKWETPCDPKQND